MFKLPFATAT